MANIASIIAAIAFAVLVLFLAVPLWKLGRLFDQMRLSVREIANSTDATVNEVNATVRDAHAQLRQIDTVTTSSARVAQDISAVSTLVSSSIARPLIRLAAFSHTTREFLGRTRNETKTPRHRAAQTPDLTASTATSSGKTDPLQGEGR